MNRLNTKSIVIAVPAIAFLSLFFQEGGGPVSARAAENPPPLDAITSKPPATAADPGQSSPPPLLTAVAPPTNLGDFVVDETALLKLGKALFWDMQLGSDGIQSCASCHFHAGADNRSKNQISPGLLATPRDITFAAQLGGGPNYQLTDSDFPFRKLSDPNCREDAVVSSQCPDGPSMVISDTNDVASSQGVFRSLLIATVPGQAADDVQSTPDPDGFQIQGINVRRVGPRNAPTVINAIFNKLQFWDGRAKEIFNGANIKGAADTTAFVYKAPNPNTLTQVQVGLNNSSLASLVTGPPLSVFEMSADGRTHQEIGAKFLRRAGKKLHTLRPLAEQIVHPEDSVLGADSRSPQPGLAIAAYNALIQQAFKREWWQSTRIIQVNSDGTLTTLPNSQVGPTLAENQYELRAWNFSLFAGLAMQQYLSTLVSDQTPFDNYQAGDTNALTAQEIRGLTIFVNTAGANGGGNCNTCHTIPEFTRASVRRTAGVASTDLNNPLINVAANGVFANYGVTPASDDPGGGDTTTSRFKAPNLGNIALTAPYFHNGGVATLEQVVQFYNRGRDFNAAPGAPLNLSQGQQDDLVAFLRNGLTDPRVLHEQAPFDHPQLFVPNGHPGDQNGVTPSGNTNGTPTATDELVEIPAVGQNGVAIPPSNFLE
ncbi:MAG: cytochrome-c peroxidase [Candidatus Binatia bacterium]